MLYIIKEDHYIEVKKIISEIIIYKNLLQKIINKYNINVNYNKIFLSKHQLNKIKQHILKSDYVFKEIDLSQFNDIYRRLINYIDNFNLNFNIIKYIYISCDNIVLDINVDKNPNAKMLKKYNKQINDEKYVKYIV